MPARGSAEAWRAKSAPPPNTAAVAASPPPARSSERRDKGPSERFIGRSFINFVQKTYKSGLLLQAGGMTRFPTGPMSGLIDSVVRYDLAESTCPPLALGELADPTALAALSLGYGTSRGDEELRALIAAESGVEADQVLVTVGAIEAMFLLA